MKKPPSSANVLNLDERKIARCRDLARVISAPVEEMIQAHTTVAIERATLRLLGVAGATQGGGGAGQLIPEVNLIVERLRTAGMLGHGVLRPFVNAMIQTRSTAPDLAAKICAGKTDLLKLKSAPEA